jgi:glycopeptide antibiotics resistance protein
MFWGMFIFYLFMALDILFLRSGLNNSSINLIPFKSISEGINVYDGIRYKLVSPQVWGNVLMFVPAGVYMMIFNKKDSRFKAFISIVIISVFIETIQYVLAGGVTDIDDVILNSFGGLIGIIIYSLLKMIFKTQERTKTAVAWVSSIVGVPVLIIAIIIFYVNF